MKGNPLNRDEIARLIASDFPLIEDHLDLATQLQPSGFDLSLREVSRFTSVGTLGASDSDRMLSATEPLPFDADGWTKLALGAYLVSYNEVVNLPGDLMALGRPRSSLLRMGVSLHTAVWDAGYRGRSQSLLTVHHPEGTRVQRNARLAQLVFFRLISPPAERYQGRYQGEGLESPARESR